MNEQSNTATSETAVTESVGDFRLEEWDLSENSTEERIPVNEGKIIARMPDLGTGRPSSEENQATSPSIWDGLYNAWFSRSPRKAELGIRYQSPVSRQFRREQFFGRLVSFGIGILVCGVGILLIDRNDSEKPKGIEVTQTKTENTPVEVTVKASDSTAIVSTQSPAQVPVTAPPATKGYSVTESIVAARPNDVVPETVATAAKNTENSDSPWSRPASDGYSPWIMDTSKRLDVASANPPYADNPASQVSMAPMTAIPSYQQTNGAIPARPPQESMLYSPQSQPNYSRTHQLGQIPSQGYASNQSYASNQGYASTPLQPNYGNQYDNPYSGNQYNNNQYNNQSYPAPPAVPNYTVPPGSNYPPAIPSGASTLQPPPYYQSQPAAQPDTYHQQGAVPYRKVY